MRLLRASQVRDDRAGIRGGRDGGKNLETDSDLLWRLGRRGGGEQMKGRVESRTTDFWLGQG